jgi:predicted DNA-binding transcriptional regulator AlpA
MAIRSFSQTEDGACVSADQAFRCLGIDRTTGYRAIKTGTFPLPVIRVGRTIRIPTAALRRLLTVEAPEEGVPFVTQPHPTKRSA